jgi:hypothetical protein
MDVRKFLETYQQLQYSIMADTLVNLDFASITMNNNDESAFWNHALLRRSVDSTELSAIEKTFQKYTRTPVLYFDPEIKPGIANLLDSNPYVQEWEDSWMFHPGYLNDTTGFEKVRVVKDEDDLQVFLKTFDLCFQKDDPQNPYGELGDYLEVTKKAWRLHKGTRRVEYFIGYMADEPVAVATLTNFAGIGYISNVGSLLKVRGMGFGKLVSLFAVNRSVENSNSQHSLTTEKGQYPYDFYQRIGFNPEFTAVGFVKK